MPASKPRVVFIAPCVPPVALAESFAVLKKLRILAEYLELTILAADDPGGYFPLANDPELLQLLPSNLRILRAPVPGRTTVNEGLFLLSHALVTSSSIAHPYLWRWARRALRMAAQENWFRDFDGMITNSQPNISHYVGMQIRHHNPQIRWLQHYSDPFPDFTYGRYNPLSRRIDRAFAARFAGAADRITVTSEETRAEMFAGYDGPVAERLRAKCDVVPHTYDSAMFDAARATYRTRELPDDPRLIHLSYIGHFYGARSLRPLYRLLDFVRSNPTLLGDRDLQAHIFGTVRARDAALIKERYGTMLQLHGPVGYLKSLAVMAESDALLVVDAPNDGVSVHFPSKLADYLGSGRPIVAFTPERGATARIIAQTGHLAVPVEAKEEDFRAICDYLLRRTAAPSALSAEYADDIRHYESMIREFTEAALARQ